MSDIKEYSNGEITIYWEAKKCWHFGACVAMLPNVYDPKARPWIQPKNGSTQELKDQIAQCPSGALSYSLNDKTIATVTEKNLTIELLKNGPFTSKKPLLITYQDGTKNTQFVRRSYCRCGASDHLPYCNGNHGKVHFKADAHTPE